MNQPQLNLLGRLLISPPRPPSNLFADAVIIVCSHSAQEGAWGLIVNKPITHPQRCEEIWRYLGWESGSHPDGHELWQGGPVLPDRVIVLHSSDWRGQGTQELSDDILVTQDPSIFEAIHQGLGPKDYKIFLGFSGWSAGQLEGELSGQPPWTDQHRWLVHPSDTATIMNLESQDRQWRRAIRLTAKATVDSWF